LLKYKAKTVKKACHCERSEAIYVFNTVFEQKRQLTTGPEDYTQRISSCDEAQGGEGAGVYIEYMTDPESALQQSRSLKGEGYIVFYFD